MVYYLKSALVKILKEPHTNTKPHEYRFDLAFFFILNQF
jgi:hypothetical protein